MILRHGPYVAKVEAEDDAFHGLVLNLRDTVTFVARDMDGLRREFARSLEEHKAFCEREGLEPMKPFSGKFALRFLDTDLHRQADMAAAAKGLSLNAYLNELVRRDTSGVGG